MGSRVFATAQNKSAPYLSIKCEYNGTLATKVIILCTHSLLNFLIFIKALIPEITLWSDCFNTYSLNYFGTKNLFQKVPIQNGKENTCIKRPFVKANIPVNLSKITIWLQCTILFSLGKI